MLQRSKVRDFAIAKLVGSRRGASGDADEDEPKAGGAPAAKPAAAAAGGGDKKAADGKK